MTRKVQALRLCRATFGCALLLCATIAAWQHVTAQTTVPMTGAPVESQDGTAPFHTAFDWNTFLGGDDADFRPVLALDGAGNILVAGRSYETWGEPIRGFTPSDDIRWTDVFVAKLDPQGNLLWNSFLGDKKALYASSLATDESGNVYVFGRGALPWELPIQPATGGADSFVAKLDGDGNFIWIAFLGGEGGDLSGGIALGADGAIYVTGSSELAWGCSPEPCTRRPFLGGERSSDMDGYVAKLDPDGNLLWNTFLGGHANDAGLDITIAPEGDLYIAGESDGEWGCASTDCTSRDFTGDADGFLAMLDSEGQLLWNTFLGGAGADYSSSIVLRNNGQIAISGQSNDMWSCSGASCTLRPYSGDVDAFVAVSDPDGTLQWNTFLGSTAADHPTGLVEGDRGRLHVAGTSYETWGEPDRAFADSADVFVAILDPTGDLLWNSFIGTWEYEISGGIALTDDDQVVLTGYGSSTWGSPIRPFSRQSDVFVAAFRPDIFPEDTQTWVPWVTIH